MERSTIENETLQVVRRVLAHQYGTAVAVGLHERLDSPHIVLRCEVSGQGLPSSVIVKHEPPERDAELPNYHFRNELANLRFLNGDLDNGPFAPHLYADDTDANLLVIEDFGTVATLQSVLMEGDDPSQAERSLVTYGTYLGRYHAATAQHEAQFNSLRDSLTAIAPDCDTSVDVRTLRPLFTEMLQVLDIATGRRFDAEFESVGKAMHEPGPFWTLAHCDAGPHNVLLPPDSAMLIDFEFGQYACCLMDMVSARMGFPHAYWGHRVPLRPLHLMEQAYRHALAQQIPQAAEDDYFELALVQACADWTLGRLSHFWKGFLRKYLEIGEALTEGRDPERVKRMKQWQITYIRAAIEAAEEFDCLPATRQIMAQLESALLRLWPDLTPLPYYAVFESRS